VSRAVVVLILAGAAACPAGGGAHQARFVLLEYDPTLDAGSKRRAVERATATLADLGIRVQHDRATIEQVVRASHGTIAASPVEDAVQLYDAMHYLGDVARLPPPLHALFSRLLVVRGLQARDERRARLRRTAIAYQPESGALLVDHENLNQLDTFGNFIHPKINFAMLLQAALEARLERLGPAVRRELGLESVSDDGEWAKLNGGTDGGFAAYNGEELSFVGLKTAARVTPPGMLYDALKEWKTGVPAQSYAGLPEPTQPWVSPRRSPAADRQNILRCLYAKNPGFLDRIGGRNGLKPDRVLEEKTRLILYAAFVASGGVLDHGYWSRRQPDDPVLENLTRDFDAGMLERLEQRLERNPDTRGFRLTR
jgi:hypothetical protein